jgi:2-polyprenyl-3-methyl-5-hydroxy-6-metoxy-1,4-benzoquinol methylase
MRATSTADVKKHYDAAAAEYHEQYEQEHLFTSQVYPANYFRLQLLLNSFANKGLKRIIEVGVGEGTPLKTLGQAGLDVWGFDISKEMVKRCKQTIEEAGMNPNQIFWGDIQDSITYAHALAEGAFDGLIAMGVMPHVENDDLVLENMRTLIRPGGSVFIEFRNKLFSLFTFNRYTLDFIVNDLLKDVSQPMKAAVIKELEPRLRMDLPPVRDSVGSSDKPGYDKILSKFHNPFEVLKLFEKHGFKDMKLLWYHYHPAMPMLETLHPELFRQEAIRLEHEPSGWRGMFLCSAFVVEATKTD